jgi:hypothetical protein
MSEQRKEEVEKTSDATSEVAEPELDVEKSVEGDPTEVTDVEKTVAEAPSIDLDALADLIKTVVGDTLEPLTKAINEVLGLTKSLSEVNYLSNDSLDEVKNSIGKSIEEIDTKVLEVSKVVDEIAAGTAVKKSGELGRESDNVQKSLWSGTFLSAEEL